MSEIYPLKRANSEVLVRAECELKRKIPIGRFGEERDLDGPLLLLVSDAGRFVTGATIVANGGQMAALRG